MKFSVGDKMLIKKTGEEGVIVGLIDQQMVEVLVNGTSFPIYIDEIDHPYLRWFTQKNKSDQQKKVLREQIPVETLQTPQAKIATGMHLTFMPVFHTLDMEERVERCKIFFVNHTHHTIELKYDVRTTGGLLFSYQGVLQAFSDIYLHFIDWDTMQDIPRFEWRIKEVHSDQYALHQDVLKIRSAKLFAHINQLMQQNLPTFQYTLLQEFALKGQVKESFTFPSIVPKTPTKVRSIQDIPKYEIDLHIEQLIDQVKGLSNADILHIQLMELERYLTIAVNNKQDKLVVIHGLGKGVLRTEVQRILKEHPFVERQESGWHAGYGFGATIAYFKY
jgi:hypothetical protein